jgi:hypothetical protein
MASWTQSNASYWASMKRNNPKEYKERQALRSIRLWRRNLGLALRGEGFYKEDYCRIMLSLHVSRYTSVD